MKILYSLLLLVPVALALEYGHLGGHAAVFVTSAAAMVPLAAILGRATEEVAIYTGPKIGALLNATLGNAAELIITIVALNAGLVAVVKASIAGSIIGNILVVLGFSVLLGGLKNGTQYFDQRAAGANATVMSLAVVALIIPALFSLPHGGKRISQHNVELLSDGVAVVMIVTYVLYLIFSLRGTSPAEQEQAQEEHTASMPLSKAIGLLGGATVAIVVMSEVLVGAVEPTAKDWGLTELFIGVMLIPLIGNVAEHLVAVQVAVANKMDLSLGIAIGSGLQVALFVTPVLVFAGILLDEPMTLVFNSYELAALVAATFIAVLISVDGESHWLEGAELIALYAILGLAFYFVP
ncbi:MAG: Ca2+:H+ antiporter [Thermomicrobiales bacterium]|jgi:Ca2+:H+ antiporter|nr:Ca2+:H+ antiporter [Thermomicrobiales bacterium]MEA2593976.1 Ca2+:H+ antiporter [Thermomicrobiales bacterium]